MIRARIGFDHYTIAHRGWNPEQTLQFARDHQFDGVQFLQPSALDERLDPGTLTSLRIQAEAMGLYLELGLPSPNPVRRARELCRSVEPAERAAEIAPQIEALAMLGCRQARVYVGDRHDRFRTDVPWRAQIDATIEVLRHLTPRLRDLGIRLAIETHADVTVDELLGILDRLHPDVTGVTLDTGNLVMRLDDPLDAVRKLAPRVLVTHIKDAVLEFAPRGLCWQARPIGSGALPLTDILAAVIRANPAIALSIELHPRTYDLPIFDPRWLEYFPGLRPESLAAVVAIAAQCERRYCQGSLPRPSVIEAIPWADRDLDWLASSLGFLRSVVPTLEAI
jgi:sugar phosphate isomerase/epimerase